MDENEVFLIVEEDTKVEVYNLEPENKTNFIEPGYFYCPYVPMVKTPVVPEPETFKPDKRILTRYDTKLLELW